MLKEKIKTLAAAIKEDIIADRQYLHQNPELSFQEFQTADFIRRRLDEIGVTWHAIANTGTIGIIKGDKPSENVIALRADIDALPIEEENDVIYKSVHKGVMHACGHDVHTASLLGAARILQTLKVDFGGIVKLIFQPAEEVLPGGAIRIISEGGLQDPKPSAVIGQHVAPWMEAGTIAFRKGKFMASMDEITLEVFGKGGHAAEPHKTIDPVVIASAIVLALQGVVSRNANPQIPSVLSIGKITGPGAINVIPDRVLMEGTFRTLDEGWRIEAHEKIKNIAAAIAQGMGGDCVADIRKGYPCLVNDDLITDLAMLSGAEYCGAGSIVAPGIWMASEDFGYYAQQVPSCFYLLGVGRKAAALHPGLHTPLFNIDEDVLPISAGLMVYIALNILESSLKEQCLLKKPAQF